MAASNIYSSHTCSLLHCRRKHMFIRNVDKFVSRSWRHCRRRRCDDLQSEFISYSPMVTKYLIIWNLWSYLCLVQMIRDRRFVYCVYSVLVLYETQRHKAIWSVGGVAERILNHGSRWWWVVTLTPRLLCIQGNCLRYPLAKQVSASHGRSGCCGAEMISCFWSEFNWDSLSL
jgi:hypothetical protein